MSLVRRFRDLCLAALLLGALSATAAAASAEPAPLVTYGVPALEAIRQANEAGEISSDQALLYHFYFLLAPERLPERFVFPAGVIKDGTGLLLDAMDHLEELPAAMRGEVQALLTRPSLPDSRTTAHFIIHYNSALTQESYIDVVETAAEAAYEEYHITQSWNVPPSDGIIGGGTGMIDCYIQDLGSGILGLATVESSVPGGAPNDYTGYFSVDDTISDEELRSVTTAHEYMHVTQYGYCRVDGIIWWLENCAMMGEEWAFDVYNEYVPYLPPFFDNPHWALDTFGSSYEYAQITWPMYLSERFYFDAVENIWAEQMWLPTASFWTATNTVLAPYGYTYESAYLEFMRWCYYTGSRNDGNHLEEADWSVSYLVDRVILAYPSGEKHPRTTRLPEGLGTSVQFMRPEAGSPNNILTVTLDGPNSTLGAEFIVNNGDGTYVEYFMPIDASGNGVIQIPAFDLCSDVHMLVSMKRGVVGQDFAFWAETSYDPTGVAALESGERIRIHPNRPNPIHLQTLIAYSLAEAGEVSVRVIDANGRLVRDLLHQHQRPGNYEITWNRQDNAGRTVESGVYFTVLNAGGRELTRQMTVLR